MLFCYSDYGEEQTTELNKTHVEFIRKGKRGTREVAVCPLGEEMKEGASGWYFIKR